MVSGRPPRHAHRRRGDVAADADFVQEALSLLGFADAARLRESLPRGWEPRPDRARGWLPRRRRAGRCSLGRFAQRPVAGVVLPRASRSRGGSWQGASPSVRGALGQLLAEPAGRFRVAPPLYPPVVGAVLRASQRAGNPLSATPPGSLPPAHPAAGHASNRVRPASFANAVPITNTSAFTVAAFDR